MQRVFAVTVAFAALVCPAAWAGDFTSQSVTVGVRKNMEAMLYIPNGAGPFPMVLQMHTSGGWSEFDRGYCGNLAREGYICISPAFLKAYGITNAEFRRKSFTTDARPITEDFVAIIEGLNALPQAKKGAVGAIGFSNGGFFAAILAARGRVKAGVGYYGAYDGARTHPDLDIFRKMWTAQSAPMLVLAGENDVVIGVETPRMLEGIMKAVGAPYEIKFYPHTGHDFDRTGSTGANNAQSAADAWRRTLAFLRANGV